MTRELLQQALDALSAEHHFGDYDDLCAALRSALAAPMPEPWMPIETAPTQGVILLAVQCVSERRVYVAAASTGESGLTWEITTGWMGWSRLHSTWTPTHWTPLPAAPGAAPPAAPAALMTDEQISARIAAIAADRNYWRERVLALESAAPVVREPQSREQQIAIREAHCNTASDEYFGARPQVDDATKRRIYEAGFKEGWESGIGTTGGGNG